MDTSHRTRFVTGCRGVEGDDGFPPIQGRECARHLMRGRAIRAYTLLELMVVLAIISLFAAVSWPMLQRPLAKSRLQGAAQQLSKALAGLRIAAMEDGQTYRFRYQLGSHEFESAPAELMPRESDDLGRTPLTESPPMWPETAQGDAGLATEDLTRTENLPLDADPESQTTRQELPDGVTFTEPHQDDAVGSSELPRAPDVLDSLPSAGAIDEHEIVDPLDSLSSDSVLWSTPILFYPDGRATNAKLVLTSEEGYQVDVNVRGLTGSIRVGRLRRVEVPSWEEESRLDPPIP